MFRSRAAMCLRAFSKYESQSLKMKNDFQYHLNPIKNMNSYRLRFYSQTGIDSNQVNDKEKIYTGFLNYQIHAVKVFSLSSSLAGIIAQPILYSKAAAFGSTPLILAVCGIVGFFTFVTPLLLHFITKKYVINIDYSEKSNTYTATTLSFIVTKKKLDFTPDDVDVPDVPGMFTSIVVKGKPLFIEMNQFKYPEHYGKIMGYDKPMDFKINAIRVPANDNDEKK